MDTCAYSLIVWFWLKINRKYFQANFCISAALHWTVTLISNYWAEGLSIMWSFLPHDYKWMLAAVVERLQTGAQPCHMEQADSLWLLPKPQQHPSPVCTLPVWHWASYHSLGNQRRWIFSWGRACKAEPKYCIWSRSSSSSKPWETAKAPAGA